MIYHTGWPCDFIPELDETCCRGNVSRFKQFAIRVFNVETDGKTDREIALEGIQALRQFWTSIEAPVTLSDYAIGENEIDLMADKAMAYGEFGNFKN